MIVLNDVSKVYQIGESEVYALDHASMRVEMCIRDRNIE